MEIQTSSGTRENILIAEDSPTQAEKLKYFLEERGYDVTVAANGRQALAAAAELKPALVISDIVMPEMDGYALCHALKADEGLKEIPFILLTALSSPEDIIKGLQCGADNFVRKPYDPNTLLSRVEQILSNRRRTKAESRQAGSEIVFAGQKYVIDSKRRQILDILLSVYEEAVRLNRELEEANKELEAFSYSVSHDLRAPLRAMTGFSGILLKDHGPALSPEARRYLELISANTVQMRNLIDDLLAFSRLSRQSLRTQRLLPGDVARGVLQDLQREQSRAGLEVSIDELPACDADPALLKQVFVNLLSNALKFTRNRDPARIEIGWSDKDAEVVYFIKDNGAGFDMRYADKLFGVFQRLHRAEEYEGTGAGLAIVHRIIHRHGGRIWAEAAVEEGATFYFTLGGGPAGPRER